jgi:phosphate transport system substrate-binding protein
MNRKNSIISIFLGAVLVALGVCAPVESPSAAPAPAPASALLINGAGATFPYPIYSKWFDAYHKLHPDIEFNYQSIGSGGGIRQITAATVDFGASDGPMNDQAIADFKQKNGRDILHFPTVMGGVVPAYNIPGITQTINFTPEALAGIFLGKITKWNDPAITGPNAGVNLPDQDIIVVHRSDGSGTTYIWVDFLSKISDEWKTKVGKATSVNWPVGLGGKGNEGVAGLVKQQSGAIGYVELIYAIQNNIPYGAVRNPSGVFVKANLDSVTAAAAAAAKSMPDDFRVSITNAPGKAAYPISSFTWLLVPNKIDDPAKKKAIVDFLHWMLKDGQGMVEALSYAKLPKAVVAKESKAISQVN